MKLEIEINEKDYKEIKKTGKINMLAMDSISKSIAEGKNLSKENDGWNKMSVRPSESGHYLIHVFEMPDINGIVTNKEKSVEYIAIAEYNSEKNYWDWYKNEYPFHRYTQGAVSLGSNMSNLKYTQIIEWKKISSDYIPAKTYKCVDGNMQAPSKKAAETYDAIHELYKKIKGIEPKKFNLRLKTGTTYGIVEVISKDQYEALVEYLAMYVEKCKHLAKRAVISEFEGPGKYIILSYCDDNNKVGFKKLETIIKEEF